MPPKVKKERVVKYKEYQDIVGTQRVQARCSCGWKGSVMVGDTDLSLACALSRSEYQKHTHIPAPPKEKKNGKVKPK